MELPPLLERSARSHARLCPRQILGVRMGLRALGALDLSANAGGKRLFVIVETDGCFVDGISAATGCAVGHRTLRVEDYGKAAATFVDTKTNRAVRIAPVADLRTQAGLCAPGESSAYAAQMKAYQTMPEAEMFTAREVTLNFSLAAILSRPGLRVTCDSCGEEIMNEREIRRDGVTLCIPCERGGYYATKRDI